MSSPRDDSVGTLRREPGRGFAHVIKLVHTENTRAWLLVDAYGPMEMLGDEEVKDWPIVYRPAPWTDWEQRSEQHAFLGHTWWRVVDPFGVWVETVDEELARRRLAEHNSEVRGTPTLQRALPINTPEPWEDVT